MTPTYEERLYRILKRINQRSTINQATMDAIVAEAIAAIGALNAEMLGVEG